MSDSAKKMESDNEKPYTTDEAGSSRNYHNERSSDLEDDGLKRTSNPLPRSGQPISPFLINTLTGASPPKFVSLEEVIKADYGMKNMALAHEIAVDKNFQLQKLEPEDNTMQKHVKDIMHKAFWDLLAAQLEEDPPNYTQALVLLGEIKQSLNELLLPSHKKIKENIEEILDIDLIRQQAEKGVLDFHHYAQYIISFMSKLCAPVRDEKIRQLSNERNVIEVFKGIMESLELMKLDLANFTIRMIRPMIEMSSIEYEKKKFAEFLKVNSNGLQYTEKWLLKHLKIEDISKPSVHAQFIKQLVHDLLAKAYLDLLEWDFNLDAETLMLDQTRLLDLRDKVCKLCIISAVMLLINNTIGASIQGITSFKNDIKKHLTVLMESVHSNKDLESVMPNIVLQVKLDVKTTLEKIGAAELPESVEKSLEGQISDLIESDHRILRVVRLRVRDFLYKTLLFQLVRPDQVPPGLTSFQEDLTAIAHQVLILVSYNRNVFGEYYQDIIRNALLKANITIEAPSANNSMEM